MPALTVASVRKYAPQTKRREIRDTLAPGLYLIVQPKPAGTKGWAMRFRRPDGRQAKLTLGSVDLDERETDDEPVLGGALTLRQARQLANKVDRQRARGIDVIAEYATQKATAKHAAMQRAASTFGGAAREFVADYKVRRWGTRPRRWHEDARLLGLAWKPDDDPAQVEPEIIPGSLAQRWNEKPVADITDDDVYAVVDECRRRGIPGLVRNAKGSSDSRGRKMHGALSVLFRWLKRHRRVRSNPCIGVERPGPPPQRQRKLTEQEVRWLWLGCTRLGPPYGPLIKTLLLTGTRLDEVTGMRRAELNDDGTWIIPSERTKNHRPHLVPLSPLALATLNETPQLAGTDLVFTNSGIALTGFSQVKNKLDGIMIEIAKDETTVPNGAVVIPPWRLHDLRRTVSTMMHEQLGIAPHIVEAVLNHVSGHKAGVAGIYNLAEYRAEKTSALSRWATHVQGIVERKKVNVVALRKT
jgi:integrase